MKTKASNIFLLIALSVITFGVVRGYKTGVISGELQDNHFEFQLQNYEGAWGSLYYIVTFPISPFIGNSVYFKMQPASFHLAFGGLSLIMWLAVSSYLLLRASEVSTSDYSHAKPRNVLPEEVDSFLELVSKIIIASGLVQGRPIVAVEKFIEEQFGLSDDQVAKAMKTFNYMMFQQAARKNSIEVNRINVSRKLRKQSAEVFDFFCQLVGDDGVFTKEELITLEELRISLALSRDEAEKILRRIAAQVAHHAHAPRTLATAKTVA